MIVSRASLIEFGFLLGMMLSTVDSIAQSSLVVTLDRAVEEAIANDDWLDANEQEERGLLEESIAVGQLPDPRMAVGLANLPTNTLNFDQEPMTQFRVGLNQMFPRGNSQSLREEQLFLQSKMNPYLREDRKASVTLTVTQLWLNAFLSEQSIVLIETDRALFEQLVEITNARYSVAAGLARQQDLVRAELELVRLEDRLAMLRQQQQSNKQKLSQWLPDAYISAPLSSTIPEIESSSTTLTSLAEAADFFKEHPRILAHNKRIQVAETGVELAKQSLKPSYSVGASYGYRDRTVLGLDRADFISLEFSFDLPIFPENRQHARIRASQHNASAREIELTLLYKDLYANYQQAMAELVVLDERQLLYSETLLGQINDLTQATLSAYTADEGDFEEVMRAYISELNTKIELLQINVERQKVLARLSYLLTRSQR